MQWFINYRQDSVSPSDRGLAYGDGLFETILVTPEGFNYLGAHLERLERGLARLGMSLSLSQKQELRHFLFNTILPLVEAESVVKVIVTRGEGGRGYLPPKEARHTVCVGLSIAPDYSLQQQKGVHLGISDVPTSTNSFLAGLKHLNRLENVIAKQQLKGNDFEAVMLNAFGHVVECIQSNIFWFKDGQLFTPALSLSGVQGTYRQHILLNQPFYSTQIGHFPIKTLQEADEIFITNSLMGIVPVCAFNDVSLPIGENTRKLQLFMQSKDVHDGF